MAASNDKHAVIWTRSKDGPLKMADLIVTLQQTRFSYTREFIECKSLGSGLAPCLYGFFKVTHLLIVVPP